MVTSGEAGIDGMAPDECRTVREAEQVESARIVGVDTVDFLRLPDGVLEYGVPLRRLLAAEVRRHRPDIVITGNFRDTWGGRNLNQADHIAVGRAVARRGPRRRQPLGLPRAARAASSSRGAAYARCGRSAPPSPTHGVDTTDTFDAGVESLEAHAAYIEGLGWENWDPREFLEGMARADRPAAGRRVRRAVRGVPDGLGRLTTADSVRDREHQRVRGGRDRLDRASDCRSDRLRRRPRADAVRSSRSAAGRTSAPPGEVTPSTYRCTPT